ncbi:hypothetical protein NDU88_003012 [Pleurodeles waltl]|uniref:Uncharacterized protein n=1 Tax=Pleurodeles waltl TaxID=8319 RepID=A0AAV7NFK9_PLEWA|nr:hypothetical protein NDU88_003012 [Pleurodeles waltl]
MAALFQKKQQKKDFDHVLKQYRIPLKPFMTSTDVEAEEEETALKAPTTPEPHEEEAEEKFYNPEEAEAMGRFEDDSHGLET